MSEGDHSCARESLPRSVSEHRRRTIAVDVAALGITRNERAVTMERIHTRVDGLALTFHEVALTLHEVALARCAFESTCRTLAHACRSFAFVRNNFAAVRRGLRSKWR